MIPRRSTVHPCLRHGVRRLLAIAAAALGVWAPMVAAHGGLHADDLAAGRELPAPAGIESEPAAAGRALAAGPRTVAVVLLNFASAPTEPWTPDQIRSTIFTGAGSVNAFEQEQSFGAISLTGKVRADGDVFGWYTIADAPTTCDPDAWMFSANTAAAAAGVALSGYQHRIYMFPKVNACGWAGSADMPGSDSFINGTTSVRVIAHELGHNIGAHHASTISCVDGGGTRVAFSATCTQSEYGDPFDVMGSSDRHSVAFRKVGYGFLGAASTATATATGTYQLAPSSLTGAGVRSLRVRRGTGSDYWYMELRSPTGVFDDFAAGDPAVTGVGLRQATDYGVGVRTRLIDTQPATATFNDAPLQPGQSFTDPLSGISIAVPSVALGVATVNVTIPGTVPQPPPGPAPPPGGTIPPGGTPPGTTPAPAATASLVVRRPTPGRVSVRIALRAGTAAAACRVRVGVTRWSACRVSGGRVALTRTVRAAGRTVPVAVRVGGRVLLATRVSVPRVGGVTRIVTALRPV